MRGWLGVTKITDLDACMCERFAEINFGLFCKKEGAVYSQTKVDQTPPINSSFNLNCAWTSPIIGRSGSVINRPSLDNSRLSSLLTIGRVYAAMQKIKGLATNAAKPDFQFLFRFDLSASQLTIIAQTNMIPIKITNNLTPFVLLL